MVSIDMNCMNCYHFKRGKINTKCQLAKNYLQALQITRIELLGNFHQDFFGKKYVLSSYTEGSVIQGLIQVQNF